MTFAKTKNRLAAAAAVPVRILILPKFEMGEITGDFPGEAQFFYEECLAGGEEYEVKGFLGTERLYYKDGVALFLLGEGKVRAALNTAAVLSDQRFEAKRKIFLRGTASE